MREAARILDDDIRAYSLSKGLHFPQTLYEIACRWQREAEEQVAASARGDSSTDFSSPGAMELDEAVAAIKKLTL